LISDRLRLQSNRLQHQRNVTTHDWLVVASLPASVTDRHTRPMCSPDARFQLK